MREKVPFGHAVFLKCLCVCLCVCKMQLKLFTLASKQVYDQESAGKHLQLYFSPTLFNILAKLLNIIAVDY